MTTQESNILIAEFLGWTPDLVADIDVYRDTNDNPHVANGLTFHESWSSLMPVVEKINESAAIHIDSDCAFLHTKHHQAQMFTKEDHGFMGMVYAAVIEYITWFNTQTL